MKKLINICLLIGAGLWSSPAFAQNDADPMLASEGFSTNPLQIGSTTTLTVKFMNFGYTTNLAAGSMRIIVNFGNTNAYTPAPGGTANIGGSFASSFTWAYNAGTRVFTGTLNATVAPGDGGFITFPVTGAISTAGAYAYTPINIEAINASQFPAEDVNNNALSAGLQVIPSTPLVLELSQFTGANDQCNARLAWTTSFEQDNDRFEIEVSNDGKQYGHVGAVKSAGNKSATQTYSYNYTMQQDVAYFFRLKMIDQKERSTYSSIVKLNCSSDRRGIVTAGPNPVTAIAHVNGLRDGKNSISIHDMKGSTLKTVTSSNTNADIDFSSYPAGVYYLRITEENGTATNLKMVKQ